MSSTEIELRVVDPSHVLGELYADDCSDCLEDDEKDVKVSVNKMVVAVDKWGK